MTPEQATKLEALRAERAALADTAKARAEPSDDEIIAQEERMLAEDRAFDEAQTKYGAKQVRMVRYDDSIPAVIVRRPHVSAYRKFQDADEASTEVAGEFVRSCLVYPAGGQAFERLLEQAPAILQKTVIAACELAGHRRKEVAGK